LWQAYRLWLRSDCVDLSAAFAYHTLQSIFPVLLIVLAVASRLLGSDEALAQHLVEQASLLLPPTGLTIFVSTLARFKAQGFGAGLLGAVLLIVNANTIYLTLQRGADRLWWNRPFGFDGLHWDQLVRRFIALRLKALVLVLLLALLLAFDQLISHARFLGSTALRSWLQSVIPTPWMWLASVSGGVDLLLSFLIGCTSTLIVLWWLPSRRVPLRPLIPGALLVSGSLTLLNLLLGRSLVLLGVRFQAYGVVGGVLVLSLWIWLVGLILYFGQCLSVVLARRRQGGASTLPQG
jgi:membrane protein